MRLIHHPMANRRQQAAAGCNIAEQQAVIRDQDVRSVRAFARAMHEALLVVERAFPAKTVIARGRYQVTGYRSVIDFERVDIVVYRLFNKRQQTCNRRSLGNLFSGNVAQRCACSNKIRNAAQTQVMCETFQRCVRKRAFTLLDQCTRKGWQFFIHQLIEQGIRFRCHADTDVIHLSHQSCRNKISHRLPDARTCLHDKIVRVGKCSTHAFSHCNLLFALFVVLIKASHQTIRHKGVLHIFSFWRRKRTLRVHFDR